MQTATLQNFGDLFRARAAMLSQFCLSVCLSVTRVLCDKTKQCTGDILIQHESAITLVFWHQQWLVGRPFRLKFALKVTHPFQTRRLRQISAYGVSVVRHSEKFNYDEYKVDHGLPASYRWSAYVIPKSPKGWLKNDFLFFKIKFNFNPIKSCYKVFCVKTSSVKVVV